MIESQRPGETVSSRGDGQSRSSEQYWDQQVLRLPDGPCLPGNAANNVTSMRTAGFAEHHHVVPAHAYRMLADRARDAGVSVGAVLLTVYLDVLARWSGKAAVCVRSRLPDAIPAIAGGRDGLAAEGGHGEFLPIGLDSTLPTFVRRARAVQVELAAALQHRACDSLAVLRRWSELDGARRQSGGAPLPYVFSSTIGQASPVPARPRCRDAEDLQTWLDAHVHEQGGEMRLSWYAQRNRFRPDVTSHAFATFTHAVDALCCSDSAWESDELPLAPSVLELLDAPNRTSAPWPSVTLHEGLFDRARDPATAQRPAFTCGGRSLSFVDLACRATQLAAHLNENGVGPSDHVVVRGRSPLEMAVAIYAVLIAGATYVPVSTTSPLPRTQAINRQAAATTVLGDDDKDIDHAISSPVMWSLNYAKFLRELPQDCAFRQPAYPVPPTHCAYIMFNTDAAGAPRGAAVTHAAAMNTLQDCAARFAIQPDDRLLAEGEPCVDRSVFDLFMPALTGCMTVLPAELADDTEQMNPARWIDAAAAAEATVWNGAPAQMELALGAARARGAAQLPSLRLCLVSGEGLTSSPAGRIHKQLPHARLVLLAGAAETAIWSAAFSIDDRDAVPLAIPRGLPMSNQRLYVLDECGRRCPPGVTGTLHIAGAGLALGYVNDAELTAQAFFVHEGLGERLYRTGYPGRCAADGVMELPPGLNAGPAHTALKPAQESSAAAGDPAGALAMR